MAHAIESGGAGTPGQIFLPFDIYISGEYLRHRKRPMVSYH